MKTKIVCFDIGGTLFNKKLSNKVDNVTLKSIAQLRANGVKVGVCTMRTLNHCKEVLPIDIDFYICLNGSYIICDNHKIYDSPLRCNFKERDILKYSENEAYYSTNTALEKARVNGFLADKQGEINQYYNLVLFDIEKNELSKYNDYHFDYWEQTKTIVIQNKNDSKIYGVKKIIEYYSMITENLIYFGDGENDMEVFKEFPSICMGSSFPKLEEFALFKTDTIENQGINKALKRLKLI